MRVLALLLIFLPLQAYAQGPVTKCFENEKSEGAISLCLTQVYDNTEEIRKTIEHEMLNMLQNGMYIPQPEYEIDKSVLSTTTTTLSPKTPENIKAQQNLEAAIALVRRDQIKQQEAQILLKRKQHHLKIEMLVRDLEKTKTLFEEYRETECKRRKARSEYFKKPFESAFIYKTCMYEMTNQRIKSLQKSIE